VFDAYLALPPIPSAQPRKMRRMLNKSHVHNRAARNVAALIAYARSPMTMGFCAAARMKRWGVTNKKTMASTFRPSFGGQHDCGKGMLGAVAGIR
jgi:hypothetical protein